MGDLRELARHLRTRSLGRSHEHYATIGSTNDRASQWARDGAPHGAVVTADAQTAGRGRRGRSWISPAAGNLYASVVIRPDPVPREFGAAALAVGVGLREGLAALGVPVQLKWPNDLLVGERKLAGILCECRWVDGTPELVAGFGINVGQDSFDDELRGIATSLVLEGAKVQSRAALLANLLSGLEPCLQAFFDGGFPAIAQRYERHCPMLGQTVQIAGDGDSQRRTVVAERLDADGALVVRDPSTGRSWRVEASDVFVSRSES